MAQALRLLVMVRLSERGKGCLEVLVLVAVIDTAAWFFFNWLIDVLGKLVRLLWC